VHHPPGSPASAASPVPAPIARTGRHLAQHGRRAARPPAPAERADAAHNRARIISAATRIVKDRGTAAVSVDEVAREAGVGVQTVYRRFGDRSGLLWTLLSEFEQQFQAAFTSGPPPLGPGAPPLIRIRAFLHGLVDFTMLHSDLLLEAESGSPALRLESGHYSLQRLHLSMLIHQLRPEADAPYLADALLAPITATLIEHQRTDQGATSASIKAGLDQLLSWALPA